MLDDLLEYTVLITFNIHLRVDMSSQDIICNIHLIAIGEFYNKFSRIQDWVLMLAANI